MLAASLVCLPCCSAVARLQRRTLSRPMNHLLSTMSSYSAHRPSFSRSLIRQPILMALLMLCVLLRSLIPAGYMPGSGQGSTGPFTLELCSVDNTVKTVLLDLGGQHAAPADTDPTQVSALCAFSALGSQVYLTATHGLPVLAPHAVVLRIAAIATSPGQRFHAGAPLGPRAPPHA